MRWPKTFGFWKPLAEFSIVSCLPFHKIQASQFTAAWQCLDGCENGLSHLGNHLVEEDDEFGIEHARVHNQQFQELYPIEIGFSPGYLRKGFRCSICGTRKIPEVGATTRLEKSTMGSSVVGSW